jgi:hypothetical protein
MRVITLIGDAAVDATTIYAIVEDPKMAPTHHSGNTPV